MEAIVGLGIIEAFSYVLLYYTFIHSLNRYERKKDKIFYIAASLAVVVRLAAIVLDKKKQRFAWIFICHVPFCRQYFCWV